MPARKCLLLIRCKRQCLPQDPQTIINLTDTTVYDWTVEPIEPTFAPSSPAAGRAYQQVNDSVYVDRAGWASEIIVADVTEGLFFSILTALEYRPGATGVRFEPSNNFTIVAELSSGCNERVRLSK